MNFAQSRLAGLSLPVSVSWGVLGLPNEALRYHQLCHFKVTGALFLSKNGTVCYSAIAAVAEIPVPDSVEKLAHRCFSSDA